MLVARSCYQRPSNAWRSTYTFSTENHPEFEVWQRFAGNWSKKGHPMPLHRVAYSLTRADSMCRVTPLLKPRLVALSLPKTVPPPGRAKRTCWTWSYKPFPVRPRRSGRPCTRGGPSSLEAFRRCIPRKGISPTATSALLSVATWASSVSSDIRLNVRTITNTATTRKSTHQTDAPEDSFPRRRMAVIVTF